MTLAAHVLIRAVSAQLESLYTPFGTLDLHFQDRSSRVGVVTSVGSFVVFELHEANAARPALDRGQAGEKQSKKEEQKPRNLRIREICHHQFLDRSTVVTSFAWDPKNVDRICVTAANGDVIVVDLPGSTDQGGNEAITVFKHSLEAWTSCFVPQSFPSQGVFSGGDDAVIQWSPSNSWITDRSASARESGVNVTDVSPWRNSRVHTAGVTAILPLISSSAGVDNILLTGSYDDHLRVLRVPPASGSKPAVLTELNLGGGVWRLKSVTIIQDPSTSKVNYAYRVRVLACCMYAGARVVEIRKLPEGVAPSSTKERGTDSYAESGTWEIDVLARFEEHESMCYGGEIIPPASPPDSVEQKGQKCHIVTCSFYDKRLCLWKT